MPHCDIEIVCGGEHVDHLRGHCESPVDLAAKDGGSWVLYLWGGDCEQLRASALAACAGCRQGDAEPVPLLTVFVLDRNDDTMCSELQTDLSPAEVVGVVEASHWKQVTHLEGEGAILVRPDGHVAWHSRLCRAHSLVESTNTTNLHFSSVATQLGGVWAKLLQSHSRT